MPTEIDKELDECVQRLYKIIPKSDRAETPGVKLMWFSLIGSSVKKKDFDKYVIGLHSVTDKYIEELKNKL